MKRKFKQLALTAAAVVLACNLLLAAPDAAGSAAIFGCDSSGGGGGTVFNGKIEKCKNAYGQEAGGPPGCTLNGDGASCSVQVNCTGGGTL